MAKRKFNPYSKNRSGQGGKSGDPNLFRRKYKNDGGSGRKLKVLVALAIFVVIGIFMIPGGNGKKSAPAKDKAQLEKAAHAEEQGLRKKAKVDSLVNEASVAFDDGNFFESVFKLRQALAFDQSDLTIHEKLIASLEKSCEGGNEMHCEVIEKAEKRLKWVIENEGLEPDKKSDIRN